MQKIAISKFKSTCLAVLEQVRKRVNPSRSRGLGSLLPMSCRLRPPHGLMTG